MKSNTNQQTPKQTNSFVLIPGEFLDSISHQQETILKLLQGKSEPPGQTIGDYVSESEAAKLLGRKTTWFWNLRKAGTLAFTKVGNKVFYSKADLLQLMERNKKGNHNV